MEQTYSQFIGHARLTPRVTLWFSFETSVLVCN